MVELEEKVYSLSDLAAWFGISYSTMRNRKKNKLEELKFFAKYNDLGRKGIEIVEVYLPVYEKHGGMCEQYCYQNFDKEMKEENGVATMSYLGRKMKKKGSLPIVDLTAERLARKVRNDKMGKPGEVGSKCHMEWGKINRKQDGKAYLFTEKDREIFRELLGRRVNSLEKVADVFGELDAGEISKKDIQSVLAKEFSYNWWVKFCEDFEMETGYWPQKVTVDDRGNVEGRQV